MQKRRSNQEVCESFRALLTNGFKCDEIDHHHGLQITKEWRNELWKAFREIEDRLCPQPTPKDTTEDEKVERFIKKQKVRS